MIGLKSDRTIASRSDRVGRSSTAARRPGTMTAALVVGLFALMPARPARAHHGKDFLLTATDDMPLRGHPYALLSVDDTLDRGGGGRGVEITSGFLVPVSERFSLEPHGHFARTDSGNGYRFAATAIGGLYRVGYLGHSQWRLGGSLEYEQPRGEEHDNMQGRLLLVRNFSQSLVALNLVAARDLKSGGRTPLSVIAGVLRPLSATDNLGLELSAPFPIADGVEVLPGLYHLFGGPAGRTSMKLGLGVFVSRNTTAGTFHTALIQRF